MDEAAKKHIKPFDFTNHEGNGPVAVEVDIAKQLATHIAKHLSTDLRARLAISATLGEHLQMSFAEWQKVSDDQCQHLWVAFSGGSSKIEAVVVSPTFTLVDQLISIRGGGKANNQTSKSLFPSKFTDAALRHIVDAVVAGLSKCGIVGPEVKAKIVANENTRARLTPYSAHEKVVQISVAISIEPRQHPVLLLITLPVQMFKRTKPSPQPEKSNSWVKQLTKHLKRTMLNIKVELGTAELTVHDLLHMSVGDIIMLDRDAEQPLPVLVEGQVKFLGLPGLAKNHRAIKITKKVA